MAAPDPRIARDIALGVHWQQRHAAALLLMAFDLPAEMRAVSEAMMEASKVAYGLKIEQVAMIESGNRLANLERARDLIDHLIEGLR